MERLGDMMRGGLGRRAFLLASFVAAWLCAAGCDGRLAQQAYHRDAANTDPRVHPARDASSDGGTVADASNADGAGVSSIGDASDASDAATADGAACLAESQPIIVPDASVCATGTAVDAWGTTVCLDLDNDVRYPGPCSERTKVIAVGDGDPSFVQSSCDFTYAQSRLTESNCSSVRLSARDVATGGCGQEAVPDPSPTCEWFEDFPDESAVVFTYDPNGTLRTVSSFEQGDMLDLQVTLDLAAGTKRTCDRATGECSVAEASHQELQSAQTSAEPSWLHPPSPFLSLPGEHCTTHGSVGSGYVTRQCDSSISEFVYDDRGNLTLIDDRFFQSGNSGSETDYRTYYDRAGNERYLLQRSVDSSQGMRGPTIAYEYGYDCFSCSYSQPDGGLAGVSIPDAGANGHPTYQFVSAGGDHTCALTTDGMVVCWGANNQGQSTPPVGTFLSVSAGYNNSCGLRADGTLVCWGANDLGQSTPPAGTFLSVSAGGGESCAVRTDHTVVCWGDNSRGQATTPAGNFSYVSAGLPSCGIKTDGTVTCWGGDYGTGRTPIGLEGPCLLVSAGSTNYPCAIKADQTLVCSTYGDFPEVIAGTFLSVSAVDRAACGVKSDHTLTCWGSYSTIGGAPPAGAFLSVSLGYYYACAVRTNHTAVCWGRDTVGKALVP